MENSSTDLECGEHSPGPDSKDVSETPKIANMVLDGLELLTEIHPAIGAIEAKRRENDKKVHILRLHMRDLMIAIFQLRRLKDPKDAGPGDLTINDRIGDLMKKIAQDIQDAGSVCELYLKKSTISKIMKSIQHQGVFAHHIEKLLKDREDLDRALQIHTGVVVDSVDAKVDNLSAQLEKLFRMLETSRERDVQIFIKDQGGAENCIEHTDLLRLLIQKSGKGYDDILGPQFESSKPESETMEKVRKELRRDWKEDVEKAFEKYMKSFGNKLELQDRELKRQGQQLQEIGNTMRMGHVQILNAMKSGAHDRIVDHDFKKLWEGMAWNRSVKAKYLVIALHDYFIEKLRPIGRPDEPIPAEYENDRWTLAYLNSPHLQPLLEAIDDDATGFITIREINTFVESKPKEWTLLQWIAYWAEGWKISIHQYKNAIYMLIAAMYKTYPRVLPANRYAIITYLQHETIFQIDRLLQSTHDLSPNVSKSTELLRLTQEFKEVERQRLQDNLKAVQYNIDAEHTVSLLTGPGHIERSNKDMKAWHQSNVDVEEKLKNFAFGMFRLYYDSPEKDLSNNRIAKYIHKQSIFDGNTGPPEVSPNNLVYDSPRSPFPGGASEDPIQGQWAGHIYDGTHRSRSGLIQLSIKSSPEGILTGEAVTWWLTMKISGNIMENNQVKIRLDFDHFYSEKIARRRRRILVLRKLQEMQKKTRIKIR
ncbi:hypothetical protein EDD18DRAFT_1412301 [Armillaria luteobubalina]|uniref:EF-hand domain-containing protein n=1 Tax=Armillaria luteobubalina TaxID=153913 RepID=A0AA39QM77_9AGAR|nr:hypothetical protein EDD18DRAFT_1412301 [Armillaria luteobubalina]